MENESGKNYCLENCQGACCRNMMFPRISQSDLAKLLPRETHSVEVKTVLHLPFAFEKGALWEKGVYFTPVGDEVFHAEIVGACPNLREDYSCGIYETRPVECRTLELGSEQCDLSRASLKLKPIFSEISTESQPKRLGILLKKVFNRPLE